MLFRSLRRPRKDFLKKGFPPPLEGFLYPDAFPCRFFGFMLNSLIMVLRQLIMVLRHLIPLVFLSSLMDTERLLLLTAVEVIVEKSALVSLLAQLQAVAAQLQAVVA